MGVLHDATGGYGVPVLVAGIVTLTGAVLILASGIRHHVPREAHAVASSRAARSRADDRAVATPSRPVP
jgi:hypothetical protein